MRTKGFPKVPLKPSLKFLSFLLPLLTAIYPNLISSSALPYVSPLLYLLLYQPSRSSSCSREQQLPESAAAGVGEEEAEATAETAVAAAAEGAEAGGEGNRSYNSSEQRHLQKQRIAAAAEAADSSRARSNSLQQHQGQRHLNNNSGRFSSCKTLRDLSV